MGRLWLLPGDQLLSRSPGCAGRQHFLCIPWGPVHVTSSAGGTAPTLAIPLDWPLRRHPAPFPQPC